MKYVVMAVLALSALEAVALFVTCFRASVLKGRVRELERKLKDGEEKIEQANYVCERLRCQIDSLREARNEADKKISAVRDKGNSLERFNAINSGLRDS